MPIVVNTGEIVDLEAEMNEVFVDVVKSAVDDFDMSEGEAKRELCEALLAVLSKEFPHDIEQMLRELLHGCPQCRATLGRICKPDCNVKKYLAGAEITSENVV